MTGGEPNPPPSRDQLHELAQAAHRAVHAVTARNDAALTSLGLTSRSARVLDAIAAPQSPTIGRLATALELDRTTLTALLEPLARAGLIRISADPDDRRARRLALTPEGVAAGAAARAITGRVLGAIEAELSLDIGALINDLDRMGSLPTSPSQSGCGGGRTGPGASRPRRPNFRPRRTP